MANNDPMQIDVTLQATDPLNVSLGEMYKGGDGSFAGLSDVALDNPTNGQVPKYNAETEKWENADDNTVSNLTDLEDVNISNPTDGQIVRYDAETDKFIADDEQVGDSVSVTQSLAQGTKVGEITVGEQTTELFAPTPTSPTEVTVTQIQSTGTKIATVTVDGTATDLFAPEGGGGASSADQISVDDTDLAYEADDVQEALEKITKSLTYAEYKALTDAEKNNGTIYLITDVNGDGQSFQPVIYSEEEREIGVWIDGKPLYEKTFIFTTSTSVSANSWGDTPISNDGIEKTIYCVAYDIATGTSYDYLACGKGSGSYVRILNVRNAALSYDGLTLRYTKTADTAGSGQWTPQGVPAVHCSTDEQVVGTWIDGSTLYERTIDCGELPNNTSKNIETLTGVKNVVNINGFAYSAVTQDLNIRPLVFVGGGTNDIRVDVSTNVLRIQTFTSWANYSAYLTIRYTKSST